MSRALEMDDLEKSLIEVRRGDHVRNTLLDDLFRKLDDMQKTMDRNAFTMVLIDGDCTLVSIPYKAFLSAPYECFQDADFIPQVLK